MITLLLAKGENSIPPQSGAAVTEVATNLTDSMLELLLATLVLVPVIVVHGWLLGRTSKVFSTHFALYTPETPRWRVTVLVGLTITALVFIHLLETLLWTVPLLWLGIISNFRDAYYYVLEAYTTLGEGTLYLPDQWRLVGPVIAISGLFTFGWTGSVLVYVMNQNGKLHVERSKADAARVAAPARGDQGDGP
jgi:hypothetical protein